MKRACLATLLACAVGCGASGPQAVSGLAVDLRGQPIANALVRVGDKAVVTTDAAGRFAVPAVPDTYDATLVLPLPAGVLPYGAPPSRAVVAYQGLKRRDPTLWLPQLAVDGGSRLGVDAFQVSYGGSTSPGQGLFVLTDPAGNRFIQRCCSGGPPNVFPWFGDPHATAPLAALLGYAPQTTPVDFAGHLPVQLYPASRTLEVPLAHLDAVTISGTTAPPSGCSIYRRAIEVPGIPMSSSDHSVHLDTAFGPDFLPNTFSIGVGWTDDVPMTLTASALCPFYEGAVIEARQRLKKGTTAYQLKLPRRLYFTPEPASTLATSFQWDAEGLPLRLVTFQRFDVNGYPIERVHLITAASSGRLPDLTALGAASLAGGQYFATAQGWDGLTTVDDAAGALGLRALINGEVDGRTSAFGGSTVLAP